MNKANIFGQEIDLDDIDTITESDYSTNDQPPDKRCARINLKTKRERKVCSGKYCEGCSHSPKCNRSTGSIYFCDAEDVDLRLFHVFHLTTALAVRNEIARVKAEQKEKQQ